MKTTATRLIGCLVIVAAVAAAIVVVGLISTQSR